MGCKSYRFVKPKAAGTGPAYALATGSATGGSGPADFPRHDGKDNELNGLEGFVSDRAALPPLEELRRPALLLRTARFALRGYRRERDLPRILGAAAPVEAARTLDLLQWREAQFETRRRDRAGGYLPSAHVAVMAALLAELRRAGTDAPMPPCPQAKASGIEALRSAT